MKSLLIRVIYGNDVSLLLLPWLEVFKRENLEDRSYAPSTGLVAIRTVFSFIIKTRNSIKRGLHNPVCLWIVALYNAALPRALSRY